MHLPGHCILCKWMCGVTFSNHRFLPFQSSNAFTWEFPSYWYKQLEHLYCTVYTAQSPLGTIFVVIRLVEKFMLPYHCILYGHLAGSVFCVDIPVICVFIWAFNSDCNSSCASNSIVWQVHSPINLINNTPGKYQ